MDRRLRHLATPVGLATVVCALVAPVVLAASPAAASVPLTGGGSGFAALEIDQWRADVSRRPYSLTINYTAQGSSLGRSNFQNNLFDFGASDIPYPPLEQTLLDSTKRCGQPLRNCFTYVPVSAGGLSFMYNLIDDSGNRVANLKLTRREACKIFTGQIPSWDDPELVATNPQLANFHRPIVVVARSDGAGESYVFSEFCIKVAPDIWTTYENFIIVAATSQRYGGTVDPGLGQNSPVSSWPLFLMNGPQGGTGHDSQSAQGSDGVANLVADPNSGKNTITYDAAAYAKVRDFPVASVENANAGVFTQPDEQNVTIALAYALGRGDGTFVLDFTGGDPRAYFPSTYSYVLAQTTGWDPAKGATLIQFLCYSVGVGQQYAPALRYARLSSQVVGIAVAAINKIPGGSCVPGGPPPPPPPSTLPPNSTGSGNGNGNASGTGTGAGSRGSSTAAGSATGSTATTISPGGTSSSVAGGGAGTTLPSETTVPGGDPASGATGVASGPTGASLTATNATSTGPSNNEVLWAIVEGAVICAVGGALVSLRKRASA